MGREDGIVVSVLTFNSNDPSLNPAESYNFIFIMFMRRIKINEKRGPP